FKVRLKPDTTTFDPRPSTVLRRRGHDAHRETDADRRSMSRSTTHLDLAAIIAHDAVHDRQAEAGAFGERAAKRLEDGIELLGGNADAFVGDLQHDRFGVYTGRVIDPRAKAERAAALHRAQTVGGEVPHDLA